MGLRKKLSVHEEFHLCLPINENIAINFSRLGFKELHIAQVDYQKLIYSKQWKSI